jgi:tRNA 2-thiouridine synthesizing protein B
MEGRRALMVVGTSPAEAELGWQLELLDRAAGKGVLLMQDGVLFATAEHVHLLRREGLALYALRQSLEARGVADRVAPGVEVVDYARAIDLMMADYDLIM